MENKMSLPKPDLPYYNTTVPSTGAEIKFRPFLVKEEKILLLALESGDESEILNATVQIIQNCVEESAEVNKLTSYDVEWLFLKIRQKSIGETTSLRFRHKNGKNRKGESCKHIQEVTVELDDVEVAGDPKPVDIKLTDKMGMKMRYPTFKEAKVLGEKDGDMIEKIIYTVASCIELIWDDDQMYYAKDSTVDERIDFLESLNKEQFKDVEKFFRNIPRLYKNVEYKCDKCGEVTRYELEGLNSFFG
jgi:hypothetical protein